MSEIINYAGENLENEVIEKNGITLIDFYADWCGPCKMLDPVLIELAKSGKYKIVKINTDDYDDLPSKFKIRSIPTVLVYKDGELVDKFLGFLEKKEFEKKLKKYL